MTSPICCCGKLPDLKSQSGSLHFIADLKPQNTGSLEKDYMASKKLNDPYGTRVQAEMLKKLQPTPKHKGTEPTRFHFKKPEH
jgi:hypothetical protein